MHRFRFFEMVVGSIARHRLNKLATFFLNVLQLLLSRRDPEVVIGGMLVHISGG